MRLFDSHAHVQKPAEELLERAKHGSVQGLMNIATDPQTLEYALGLAYEGIDIYRSGATTPHDIDANEVAFFQLIEQATAEKKLHAIGETGLDYYYTYVERKIQQEVFIRYAHLAKKERLPLIIHCREAFEDLFSILDNERIGIPILLHCFTGTKEEAERALDRNYSISFSGIITFPNAHELREVVSFMPIEKMLIETDTPYLAPVPYRGKKNEPSYIIETAKCIAATKKMPLEHIAEETFLNAETLFRR